MNDVSSRSHAIFTILFTQVQGGGEGEGEGKKKGGKEGGREERAWSIEAVKQEK